MQLPGKTYLEPSGQKSLQAFIPREPEQTEEGMQAESLQHRLGPVGKKGRGVRVKHMASDCAGERDASRLSQGSVISIMLPVL